MAIFAGTYDHLTPPELARMISETSFVCMMLSFQLSKLVNMSVQVSQLLGVTFRISEMVNEMQTREFDGEHEPESRNQSDSNVLEVSNNHATFHRADIIFFPG